MTEPHPNDHLFRAVFSSPEEALGIFRAVLPPALLAALDPGSLELEEGSFVDAELRGQESDLLFRARLGGRPVRLYVLLEHQSRPDPLMPLRLLIYVTRIWERLLRASDPPPRAIPAIIPIVVANAERPWTGPRRLADLVDLPVEVRTALAPHLAALEFFLDDLAAQPREALEARRASALARLAFLVLKAGKDGSDIFELLEGVRPLIEELIATSRGREGFVLVLRYTSLVTGVRRPELAGRVRHVLGPEAQKVVMDAFSEVKAEGRIEALREVLLRQLTRRFGTVPMVVRQRVSESPSSELERWTDRVVTAQTLDEVFAPDA